MDKNEMKQLLLENQFTNTQENSTSEEFLEMLPSLLTILNEETSDLFHLALKHIYPTGLSHVPIDEWEQVLLKDSLPAVLLHVTRIMSEIDKEIGDSVMEESGATDLSTRNIFKLIQCCDNVLFSINSLLESTLCQYNVVGSKLPSLLLCIADIMMTVWSHCARINNRYASYGHESVSVALKKLYCRNKLVQTTYLSLLDEKINFSDSQDTEVLEESLSKLCRLASVVLQLDVSSAYAAFKTYCSVAIKYVSNLRNTLHVTPAVQAMAQYVTRYLDELGETAQTSSTDPLQTRQNKLFRVFVKLILDLVAKYSGSLRDTHPTLVSLLVTMYTFNYETKGEMSTLSEAAANNLVTLCIQDAYFMSELLNTENSTPGFLKLCVIVMKKCLDSQTEYDGNKLALIKHVIKSLSHLEAKYFLGMIHSGGYKTAVSTLTNFSLILSSADYVLLEAFLFENLLSRNPAVSMFVSDVWCIMLNIGPKSLFESTCEFLVQFASAWDSAVYNFEYISLVHMVRRCLRDLKPGSVKKMFANGTLSYEKYPVLLTIAPEIIASKISSTTLSIPSTLPIPTPSHTHDLLRSLLVQPHVDVTSMIQTLNCIDWDDPSTHCFVQIVSICLQAKLVNIDTTSITQLFQAIAHILSSSNDPLVWLSTLQILSSISIPSVSLDTESTEDVLSTVLTKANEDENDYVNKAIANYIAAVFSYLDKSVILRVLKKSGKVALVTKFLTDHDLYENMYQLGLEVQMKCACSESETKHDEDMETLAIEDQDKPTSPGERRRISCDGSSPNPGGMETFDADVKSEEVSTGNVSQSVQDDLDKEPLRAEDSDSCANRNSSSGAVGDAQGELKCRVGVLDSNKIKRIKLEENVQANVEIEKALTELESLVKLLSEKKCLMNSLNKDRFNELHNYFRN